MDMIAFARAVAAPEQPSAAFAALCRMAEAEVGARLFTMLTIDEAAGLLRRSFSNRPEAYPAGGTKRMADTRITDLILTGRRPILSDGREAVVESFPDHELIFSLGCESCLNVPIVVADEVVGSMNLLDEAGHYTPQRIAAAEALVVPAALAFLMERQWGGALTA